jgi:hypothetical protein
VGANRAYAREQEGGGLQLLITQDLQWTPFDPEPTPHYIDVEVALDGESGFWQARGVGITSGFAATADEAAEMVRAGAEMEMDRPVKIRRPAKPKKRKSA